MKNHYTKFIYSIVIIILFVSSTSAQKQESLWSKVSIDKVKKEKVIFNKPTPNKSILVSLDIESFKLRLLNIAKRGLSSDNEGVRFDFPNQEGNFESYLVKEASVMTPELQAQYPEIRAYVGKGIDNPTAIIRFSLSPQKGLSSMVLSDKKTVFIEPYSADLSQYMVFVNAAEDGLKADFECGTEYAKSEFDISDEAYIALRNADDQTLRTYRLALACTVEYAQFHGGTFGQVTAAMNVTMARVNGVFERDLGLTMVMVPNTTIVFLGPDVTSDPYTNQSGTVLLSQNQTTCDSNIGSENYDIGHVFSTGGGGIALLASVCRNNSKAGGVTGSFSPQGDTFDIDFVAHEFGHQFGGNHTQNNSCQRSAVSVEPGSGSTIMGYAGICAPNVQNNSDDYFHGENIKEMWLNIFAGTGSSCFTGSTTNNAAPQVNAGANFAIPKATAFVLKGAATDANTAAAGLTYCWEQTDTTPATMPPQSANTGGPAFRSLDPTTLPDRYMPPLNTVMSGSLATTWEVVSSVARDMNFLLTVRDNELDGGATGSGAMEVSVEDVTPFTIVTPPIWGQNTSQQANWVVGATADATINCQSVNILFTTDNGASFTTLASGVPNTGSATITVPNIADTSNAKILVEAADNIFYAVSNAFEISDELDFSIVPVIGIQEVCFEDSVTFSFDFITSNGFSENTTLTATGIPPSATTTFSPSSINADGSFTLTVGNLGATTVGVYDITVTGTSTSLTRSANVVLDRSCTGTDCTLYATAQNLNIAIPDPSDGFAGSVSNTFTIPDTNTIESVTLTVDISHTWISDLEVYIIPPGGTFADDAIRLWNNECTVSAGPGYNNFAVTFDDEGEAFPGVNGCSDDFTGVYIPDQSLSTLSGLEAQGEWELFIVDFFNGDTGTLNNWSIEICYEAPLSIADYDLNELSIFPNPTNGEFTINFIPKSGKDITVEVYNIRGRAIYMQHYNSVSRFEEVISLNNVQSGVYLLRILDGPLKVTKKIIVD
jgi:subtilisin-like proprotein convertase family protein